MSEDEISDFELGQLIEDQLRLLRKNGGSDVSLRQRNQGRPFSIDQTLGLSLLVNVALIKAALSGSVSPRDLLPNDVSAVIEQAILTEISSQFDLIKDDEETRWCIKLMHRTEIINSLILNDCFNIEINKPLPQTDPIGLFFRRILRGELTDSIEIRRIDNRNILHLIQALEWLQYINIPKPDIEELRIYWRSIQLLPDQQLLLKSGFIGRRKEIKILKKFILREAYKDEKEGSSIIVSGIGGAGKSTLMAKLCQDLHDSKQVLLAVLDFDKPGMDPGDTYWLESEMTRQIMIQFPQLYKALNLLRKEIQSIEYVSLLSYSDSSLENKEKSRSLRRLISGLKEELIVWQLETLPLVLILDTFEEVTQRHLVPGVQDWLEDLQEYLRPVKLKVIFSGRFSSNAHQELLLSEFTESILVTEFDKKISYDFLINQNLDALQAAQISNSKILPKRPLELKLLAQVLLSDNQVTVSNLEAEMRLGNTKDLFAGIVYRRVLLRIKDPVIRKMAYPGLILRYLTASLIKNLIIPVLEMDVISDGEAERIIDDLASYAWLAHRTKNNEVWHRKDLRRSMLKLMVSQQPQIARRIHLAAISYFASSQEQESRTEVIYHMLMSAENEKDFSDLNERECKMAWPDLQADIDDMPIKSRVIFRYFARRTVRPDEIYYLPEKYRTEAARSVAQQFTTRGLYSSALDIMYKVNESTDANNKFGYFAQYNPVRPVFDSWEITMLLNTAEWNQFSPKLEVPNRKYDMKYLTDLLYINTVIVPHTDSQGYSIREQVTQYKERYVFTDLVPGKGDILNKLLASLVSLVVEQSKSYTYRWEFIDILKNFILEARGLVSHQYNKQLFLTELIVDHPGKRNFSVSTSMLPLDLSWLERLVSSSSQYIFINPIHSHIGNLKKMSGQGIKTIIRMLAFYDRSRDENTLDFNSLITRHNKEQMVDLLIGSYPEFRNPCKYAIIDVMVINQRWDFLIGLFAGLIPIDITELNNSDRLIEKWEDKPETELDPYIELIDRCWSLPRLMEDICHKFPGFVKIELVRRALTELDNKARYIISSHLR